MAGVWWGLAGFGCNDVPCTRGCSLHRRRGMSWWWADQLQRLLRLQACGLGSVLSLQAVHYRSLLSLEQRIENVLNSHEKYMFQWMMMGKMLHAGLPRDAAKRIVMAA